MPGTRYPTRAKWRAVQVRLLQEARAEAMLRELGLKTLAEVRTALSYRAVDVGEGYHARIAALYHSQYAKVERGPGGEVKEWDRYAKSCKYPCVYHNAGAEVSRDGRTVYLHPTRGKTLSVPMPPAEAKLTHHGLLHGDLYALPYRGKGRGTLWTRSERRPQGLADWSRGVIRRHAPDGALTGYAVLYPHPWSRKHVTGYYWEHGTTLDDCRQEYERKRQRWLDDVEACHLEAILWETRRQDAARAAAMEKRLARRARLLARIGVTVPVTRDDARATGACLAGIQGWCQRAGIAPEVEHLPAREIVRLGEETHEPRAVAAALVAARRYLAAHAA